MVGPDLDPIRRDYSHRRPRSRGPGPPGSPRPSWCRAVTRAGGDPRNCWPWPGRARAIWSPGSWAGPTSPLPVSPTSWPGCANCRAVSAWWATATRSRASPTRSGWLRPDVLRGLRAVAHAGLVYDLVVLPHQLPAALPGRGLCCPSWSSSWTTWATLRSPPGNSVSPGPDDDGSLATLPNTCCKLSGMVTEADWHSWPARRPGPPTPTPSWTCSAPTALMFGSDWPVCRLAASYAEVVDTAETLTASLTPTELQAVFTTTATTTYKL